MRMKEQKKVNVTMRREDPTGCSTLEHGEGKRKRKKRKGLTDTQEKESVVETSGGKVNQWQAESWRRTNTPRGSSRVETEQEAEELWLSFRHSHRDNHAVCKSREAGSYRDNKAGEKSTSSKVRLSNPQTRAAVSLAPKAQVRNIHKRSLPFSHKQKLKLLTTKSLTVSLWMRHHCRSMTSSESPSTLREHYNPTDDGTALCGVITRQ
ncbi:hypothetical protein KUCAC02_019349 [Chaenocephalus aceratus]|uniref:Uncharacterized protein n=1 Tax=Chaenocephalus aceratus TaxID=36190 RepID=A0ACB9VNI8_CHAAC|nr:hypothetical protein KUCAC02_019349 [Chaenocephalus aceratus]